jgi:hypothetical protein
MLKLQCQKLIQDFSVLSFEAKEKWLQKLDLLSEDELQKLIAIFERAEKRNAHIKALHEKSSQERAHRYKVFLDDFQHHNIPKLMQEIESESQTADTKSAEKLLDNL